MFLDYKQMDHTNKGSVNVTIAMKRHKVSNMKDARIANRSVYPAFSAVNTAV